MTANELPTSHLASWSLALGILGLCMWLLAPIALALSIAATRQMKHAAYSDGSKAAATVGGVLGLLGTILLAAIFLGDLF
jgi:hypothetical protein